MPINREWLEERMLELGITMHFLKNYHGFSPCTLKNWDAGMRPRPRTIRRLSEILKVTYLELIQHLNVTPGDFTDDGRRLTDSRLKKNKKIRA